MVEAMAEVVIQEVETYVVRCQNTVANFIATRPIMDLCMAEAQITGQGCQIGGGIRSAWNWRGY